MYSIGKLAKLSHASVRALRYYDEISLLPPTTKNAARHRYYTDKDISKLHHILLLKDLGFSLETIQELLSTREFDLQSVLGMRKKMIQTEQQQLSKMEASINTLLVLLETNELTNWENVFETFTTFPTDKSPLQELWTAYFSEDEQRILNKFATSEENRQAENEWTELIEDVRSNLYQDPKSPVGQKLAKRWMDKVEKAYDENLDLAQKVWDLNKKREPHLRFFQFEQEIINFIDQATRYYYESGASKR
ncbi:transcriptional regulator, MerR family protein [Planococcus donghaensis MPA1U2]|uniref:Transcriptional regulator, MerR family protein n=1 Tax=Planococcus donghaensis MPA1U2 TaxID=933115 RepID=E7RCQ8_9BACL|nr:MerR family transcriptional regulator [Planococcus donghaensis]EGA91423.1 transcriptional regulator, MerR family protein [Planococcus donghaensis MPA1U2]